MAMNDDWKNDPKLKEIDKTKLDMLQETLQKRAMEKGVIRHDAIFNECCCFRKKEWTAFFTK